MNNWSSFSKRIIINKPVSIVYDAWAIPNELEIWFLEQVDFKSDKDEKKNKWKQIEKHDTFVWKWHNWDTLEKGKVLEANGNNILSFTFGIEGQVKITLNDLGESTELILIQSNIPTDEISKMNIYIGCITGWTFWLTNLKAYLEYNITLHAKGLKQNETNNLVNS